MIIIFLKKKFFVTVIFKQSIDLIFVVLLIEISNAYRITLRERKKRKKRKVN